MANVKEIVEAIVETKEYKMVVEMGGNPDDIIEGNKRIAKYGLTTAISLATSSLNRWIELQNTDTVEGTIVGAMDRFGSKMPITYPCILKGGKELTKLCTWDPSELETPARVIVRGEYNETFKNWSIKAVESVKPIAEDKIIANLYKISMKIMDDVQKIEHMEKGGCYIVSGEIASVRPMARIEATEINGEKTWAKTGEYNLLEANEATPAILTPVFEIALDSEGTNKRIKLQFGKMNKVGPTVEIADLGELLSDVMDDCAGDLQQQCEIMSDALRGRQVVAIGEMVGYNVSHGKEGTSEPVDWIQMKCSAIYELDEELTTTTVVVDETLKSAGVVSETEEDLAARLKAERAAEAKAKKKATKAAKKDEKPIATQEPVAEPVVENELAVCVDDLIRLSKMLNKAPGDISHGAIKKALCLDQDTDDAKLIMIITAAEIKME